jgi:glycosyltransferase involved in cell wall biosynthesis
MRILHIVGYTVERGGPSQVVYENAKFQLAHGHTVSILSVDYINEEKYPLPNGAKLILLKNHWLSKFIPDFSLETFKFFKDTKNDFDIIHIHGIWFWGGIVPFFVKSKAKKIITIHGMLSKWTLAQGYLKKKVLGFLVQNRTIKKADAIFVLTDAEQNELLDFVKVDRNKIHLVFNAIEPNTGVLENEKNKLLEEFNLNIDSKKILFLSRIHKKKGLDLLIKAYGLLCLETTQNIELVIAGPDDGFKDEALTLINSLNISKNVKFIGSVSGQTKQAVLAFADVFVLSSYSEGFPISVLEALESNLPVVVSDQTRIDFYLKKYDAGKVVSLNEVEIKDAIKEILFDTDLAQKYINNGKKMINELFRPDKVYGKALSIYQELIK